MQKKTNIVLGRNPVLEALLSGQPIDKIYVQTGSHGSAIQKIYQLSKPQKIPVVQAPRAKIEMFSDGGKSQGVVAIISPVSYILLENLVDKVQRGGDIPNFLILDRITDPHNLGAIIRSAEVFGCQGIIISHRESSPITEVVVKSSAGAIFNLDICKVGNLNQALKYLKNCGVWIFSTSSHSEKSLWKMDFTTPQAVIIGSEGKGVRPLLLNESDDSFRIPQTGKTESLNVSVAAGIVLGEILRQRTGFARSPDSD